MDPEEITRLEALRPRAFDIGNPAERDRLMRETLGYAAVSLHYGTDLRGRVFACDALREALTQGYRLTKGE